MHPKTKNITGADEVFEKFGVSPQRFIDYQAIAGDASDNIPGVRGIGPKTAAALVQKYLTIEDLYTTLAPSLAAPGASVPDLVTDTQTKNTSKKSKSSKTVPKEYAKVSETTALYNKMHALNSRHYL